MYIAQYIYTTCLVCMICGFFVIFFLFLLLRQALAVLPWMALSTSFHSCLTSDVIMCVTMCLFSLSSSDCLVLAQC